MLNVRLATIAKYITPNSLVVDVGTDHALLPIFLIQNNLACKIIGVEINQGPFLKARKNVSTLGLEKDIELRQGDGLEPVLNEQVDVVVIAGMGGKSIVEILKRGASLLKDVKKIILQPMNGCELVRNYLFYTKGLKISDEDLVKENNRLYEIIIAEPGQSQEFDDILIEIGPMLYSKRHPLFPVLLERKIQRYRKIANNMDKSNKITAKDKMKYYDAKANCLEKVLVSCL
ncbi:MAG: hypothetical protein APF76_13890 [Desulfitibacter sp. BRH_c19]|nr:MAG: hypothetical protein APF76_13890 [Desulfitibacter sp. BRH_c19]